MVVSILILLYIAVFNNIKKVFKYNIINIYIYICMYVYYNIIKRYYCWYVKMF